MTEKTPSDPPRRANVQSEYRHRHLRGGSVPWAVHVQAFEVYRGKFGESQSAERIAERGGFGYRELQCLLAGHWGACSVDHDRVPGWIEDP